MSMATSAATPISIPPAPSIDTLPLLDASMSTPVCPSNTKLPASESTVRLPADAFIVPASVRVISPSKNKSCQAWVAEPKSYVSSVFGIRLESISALKLTESVLASPNVRFPPNTPSPLTFKYPNEPVEVDEPVIEVLSISIPPLEVI